MAWISVHEQVLGGKLRNLAKEIGCSQNEALGLLIRLWLWGINNADKYGRIIGADKDDVVEIINIGKDNRYSAIDAVNALIETSWIDLDDGLYLHDWDEWQEQWYKAIQVREKDAARKREERKKKRLERTAKDKPSVEDKSGEDMEEVLPSPRINIPKEQPKKEEYPDGFNEFWDVYPRKVGKGDAYKKYKARLNSGWKPEELLEAAKNYASKVIRERTEKQYIKHPKTFLSDSEPFVDFIREVEERVVSESNEDDPFADWRS